MSNTGSCDGEPLLSAQEDHDEETAGGDTGESVEAAQEVVSSSASSVGVEDTGAGPSLHEGPWWRRKLRVANTALRGWIRAEALSLFHLSFPIILALIFQEARLMVSLIFIGQYTNRSQDIDVVGLGTSLMNVTGYSIAVGLATASDTLSSQAYGYKNYKRLGIILQRGMLIFCVCMVLVTAVWLNTESLLLLIQQPPCVARLTATYVQIYIFALPFIFFYVLLQSYLQPQGIVWLFALVGLLTNVIGVILHGILIYGAGLGLVGAALAMVLSSMFAPLMTLLYIRVRKLHSLTWGGWSWEGLRGWGQYMRLGIPGLLMICFEWWSAEIATFVSGTINETELAVNAIWFQVLVVMFMVPLGVGIAVTVRVGNELGAGNPKGARRASIVSIGCILCIATLYVVILQTTKNHIGKIFTKDEEVIHKLALLMDVGCVFVYSDQLQVAISGILRGMGRQYIGAVVNFICYYLIGLPIGIPLALKAGYGARGVWIGLAIGNIIQCIVFVIVLYFTNWEKQAQKAMATASESVASSSTSLEPSDTSQSDPGDTELKLHSKENEEEDTTSLDSSESDALAQLPESQFEEVPLTSDNESAARKLELTNTGDCSERTRERESRFITFVRRKRLSPSMAKLKLVLYRCGIFSVAVVILLGGVVASRYQPPVDSAEYANCSAQDSGANISEYVPWGLASASSDAVGNTIEVVLSSDVMEITIAARSSATIKTVSSDVIEKTIGGDVTALPSPTPLERSGDAAVSLPTAVRSKFSSLGVISPSRTHAVHVRASTGSTVVVQTLLGVESESSGSHSSSSSSMPVFKSSLT